MSVTLELLLLGEFEARVQGHTLRLRTQRAAALLAVLALRHEGRPRRRESCAELLWSDAPSAQRRHSLRQVLTEIHAALGPQHRGILHADRHTVGLVRSQLQVDVYRFEGLLKRRTERRVSAACDLYRGDLLANVRVHDWHFTEWLVTERARLKQLAIEAHEQHLAHCESSGTSMQRMEVAKRLLRLDPLCESATRALMRGYAGAGEISRALAAYERCAKLLRDEIGVSPEPKTQALLESLRRARSAPARGTPAESTDEFTE